MPGPAPHDPISRVTADLFARYGRIIAEQCDDPVAGERLSLANLAWMCGEGVSRAGELPLDKISRWLGFVQGCLAMRGLIDVDAERNASRPLFHAAYAEAGTLPPPTLERPEKPRTEAELLARATCFDYGFEMSIERRGDRWVVSRSGRLVLNSDFSFEYEAISSGHDETFTTRTRFTLEGAFDLADRYIAWVAALELVSLDLRVREARLQDLPTLEQCMALEPGSRVCVVIGSADLGFEPVDLVIDQKIGEGPDIRFRGKLEEDLRMHRGRCAGEVVEFDPRGISHILHEPGGKVARAIVIEE